jgi:hypothetical protein
MVEWRSVVKGHKAAMPVAAYHRFTFAWRPAFYGRAISGSLPARMVGHIPVSKVHGQFVVKHKQQACHNRHYQYDSKNPFPDIFHVRLLANIIFIIAVYYEELVEIFTGMLMEAGHGYTFPQWFTSLV